MYSQESKLRPVLFALGYEQFIPNDDSGQKGNEESSRQREGRFYGLAKVEEQSAQSGRFREKTVAVVEDIQTGKLHFVDLELMHFTDNK
ncbi:MAG: hypothetical protein II949_12085 [Prevotella sp.]|nr:hypothetical protein [Prevotella sp.]